MILAAGAPAGDGNLFVQMLMVVVATALINNFVLHYFVGICPFIGVSRRIDMAFGMGMAVLFVMTIAAMLTKSITFLVTGNVPYGGAPGALTVWLTGDANGIDLSFLNYVVYILVIAGAVQFVELYVRKFFPALYKAFGVFLPLITTNCAILFCCLLVMMQNKGFLETFLFAIGGSLGFTIAITIMAGIREELDLADVPAALKGPGITLIIAGILALAFMGFNLKPKAVADTGGFMPPGPVPTAELSASPAPAEALGQPVGN